MGTVFKIVIITLFVGGLVFARSEKNNLKSQDKKVKGEHFWVKDYSKDNSNNQLDRKRSHKRRRKIRKPVKGLR